MITKQSIRFITLLVAFLGISTFASAQDFKIGFVSAQRILQSAPQVEYAMKKLEKEFESRQKEIISMQKRVHEMEDKMAKDAAVMSDAERRDKEREILASKRDLQRAETEYREDVSIRRNEELNQLQKRVTEVIVDYASTEKFDLIVSEVAVVYYSDRIDVTDRILEKLEADFKAKGK